MPERMKMTPAALKRFEESQSLAELEEAKAEVSKMVEDRNDAFNDDGKTTGRVDDGFNVWPPGASDRDLTANDPKDDGDQNPPPSDPPITEQRKAEVLALLDNPIPTVAAALSTLTDRELDLLAVAEENGKTRSGLMAEIENEWTRRSQPDDSKESPDDSQESGGESDGE